MQTTSATSTGHTDLLSGILKVQVRNEEKITEQDRIYCQNQQDELYKTLDQIAWWYNIFKREAEKYEGKIKLKHEPNGKITTSSYDLHYRYNNDEKDYTHHEFTPFKNINELVDSRHNAIRNFISRIIGYFNNTYSVSVEAPKIDEKTLPIDFRPVYNTYVDVVIEHLGGKSFRDTAEEELIKRFLETVRPSNWSKVKPELKKDKIIFPDIVYWDSFELSENDIAERAGRVQQAVEQVRRAAIPEQLTLFAEAEEQISDRVITELKKLDLSHMTPMEALTKLYDLQMKLK